MMKNARDEKERKRERGREGGREGGGGEREREREGNTYALHLQILQQSLLLLTVGAHAP